MNRLALPEAMLRYYFAFLHRRAASPYKSEQAECDEDLE
jgi:hypothetical protein